ncbi:MAG: MraY family glycosyltransferase [Gammaproteobacteria bacterium]
MPLFLAFIVALAITTACTPLLQHLAPKVGLTDSPGGRKMHTGHVPRVGGIAMVAGILVPTLAMAKLNAPLTGLLCGLVVLLVFGVWDDRTDLDYRLKFLGQVLAVALCMVIGDVRIESVTLDLRHQLPEPLSWALTLVFLVGVTNAINLADGLDGLAGGLALLCLCAIGAIAAIGGNSTVTAVALIESGAILGFLRFNTHPARVFMGDGGSQVLGFSIGVLAIMATQAESSPLSASLPLLLMGLPILDTLVVMASRIRSGRSPFSSDRNHFHHRLLGLGFAHPEAVVLIYCVQVALFLLAYFLRFESDLWIVGAFGAFTAVFLLSLRWAAHSGWRAHTGRALPIASSVLSRLREAKLRGVLMQISAYVMGLGLVAYAVAVIVATSHIGGDIGVLCAALLAMLLFLSRTTAAQSRAWPEHLAAFISVILLVYLDQTMPDRDAALSGLTWVIIGVTFGAALLHFALQESRRFEVTALDVLIAFIALVVPNLPGFVSLPEDLPAGIVKAVALLYVVEMFEGVGIRRSVPRAFLAVTLTSIAIRGLAAFAA